MKILVAGLFLLVGLINFVPIIGVLGSSSLTGLYNISLSSPDILLLLRHRAVLLAIVGGLMLFASVRPSFRIPAAVMGYVSMLSFIVLWRQTLPVNEALTKVAQIDIAAVVILTAACVGHWRLRLAQAEP